MKLKNKNDNSNLVGDGGFSLRTKSIMIKILNTISVNNTIFNNSTLDKVFSPSSDFILYELSFPYITIFSAESPDFL